MGKIEQEVRTRRDSIRGDLIPNEPDDIVVAVCAIKMRN